MDITTIKKLIESSMREHTKFVKRIKVGERYYINDNDIRYKKASSNTESENPLRNADNRIPFNWHGFLVNQKAAYMFTYPPTFDVGDDKVNSSITDVLGDCYAKVSKTLCVNSSNGGKAWLHVWKSDCHEDCNEFKYAVVDAKQIIPAYSNDLEKRLIAVLRVYDSKDESAKDITVYEYWTDKECYAFRSDKGVTTNISAHNMFTKTNLDTNSSEQVNIFTHDFGEVPFIEFPNNDLRTSDLDNVKALIDTYDKVFSGFVNDIEDIQEVIFVLTNYGGTDLDEFLGNLKRYKTVDMQNSGADDKSGLSTITIDIPVEARNKLLEMTEKKIYVQGQGVDPNPEKFGNASGVALKYLYTLLELKAGLLETEFRLSFGKLVRMICKHLGYSPKKVTQSWTRNMITNDLEDAQIAQISAGNIPGKLIRRRHPWVEDAEEAEILLQEEEQNEIDKINPYTKEGEGNEE